MYDDMTTTNEEVKLTEEEIKHWKDLKCVEPGCMYMREKGYIYCTLHLHDYPSRLPDNVIEYFKNHNIK